MLKILLSIIFLLFGICPCTYAKTNPPVTNIQNSASNGDLWNSLLPYFLPDNSPQKATLDRIFSKRRVLSSKKNMRKAGFLLIAPGKKIIVARHYRLRGFIVKAYLDKPEGHEEAEIDEAYWWKARCDGARAIQQSIDRYGYQNIMKVPKKWVYPLPVEPRAKKGYKGRNYILLVEDMYTITKYENQQAYKEQMTPVLLDALYVMMRENRLYDSVQPSNTCFCEDGKLAFLDTEYVNYLQQPMPFATLTHDLNPEMQNYWTHLINNNGP